MRLLTVSTLSLISVLSPVTILADDASSTEEMQMLATTSSWTNQSGSVASIGFTLSPSQPATYIVSGYYVNNTQGYNCQGTAYPITGIYYANTQTLSFSVAWSNSSEDCQSVTGWTGYVDYGATPLQIVTNWNLAYESTGGSQIMQGQDTFTRNQTRTQNDLIAD